MTQDQAAQEQVFAQLQPWQRQPETIRRLLTHALVLVPATDRRAACVGLDAYAAAGGTVQRDLFSGDRGGGWMVDPVLLERLVTERMAAAEAIQVEGWRWVAIGKGAAAECHQLRRVWPDTVALSGVHAARRDELAEVHDGHGDDLSGDVAAKMDAIERELDGLDARIRAFPVKDMAQARASLTLAADGSLRIERGFVRPEDEAKPEPVTPGAESGEADGIGEMETDAGDMPGGGAVTPIRGGFAAEDTAPALSATLLAELEAHRMAGCKPPSPGSPGLACACCCMAWRRTPSTAASAARSRLSTPTPLPCPPPAGPLATARPGGAGG